MTGLHADPPRTPIRFGGRTLRNRLAVERITEGFAAAALRARKAGFDGVEIHTAYDYLLDQFPTEYANRRTDAYGGSVANRTRRRSVMVD